MSARDDRRWKVGDLAEATGLTVRTLHHYDDVGLLVPSERTAAGHRLYAEEEVRRLYRILALRHIGLRLDEIASLLDDDVSLVEIVRRHLERVERELEHRHRLRQRLRQLLETLERSAEPSVDEFIDAMEAMTMIEASVEDVLIRLPGDEAEDPPPRLAREDSRVVLLREHGGERVLPIWIGAQEGDALVLERRGRKLPRPLGPDLTARLLKAGGVRVERVVIESFRDNTFYATVTVAAAGESHEVDARPSDALNLAVRLGAPVFVAAEVLDEAGVVSDPELRSRLSDRETEARGGSEALGGWRSLSPELIRSLYRSETSNLFKHFAEQGRQVVTLAQEEAETLARDHVGTEHLLLGLLREGAGLAARVLGSLDITAERVRGHVVHTVGSGDEDASGEEVAAGQMPFTPRAKRVLERALREALALGRNGIGSEHILLGLLREDETVLLDLGVEVERVRANLYRELGALPPDESAARATPPDSS